LARGQRLEGAAERGFELSAEPPAQQVELRAPCCGDEFDLVDSLTSVLATRAECDPDGSHLDPGGQRAPAIVLRDPRRATGFADEEAYAERLHGVSGGRGIMPAPDQCRSEPGQ